MLSNICDAPSVQGLRVLGVDPGVGGALALLVNSELVEIADVPVVEVRGKRRIDPAQLVTLIASWKPDIAIVEHAAAMPKQGVSSMFGFGKSAGLVLGVLAGLRVPTTEITAAKWKRALQVPAGKDGARARAGQLLPTAAHHWPLKRHDGRAEAALLALFGMQMNGAGR
jgi:crossover junction endodeoxyribonuclease RuvC